MADQCEKRLERLNLFNILKEMGKEESLLLTELRDQSPPSLLFLMFLFSHPLQSFSLFFSYRKSLIPEKGGEFFGDPAQDFGSASQL